MVKTRTPKINEVLGISADYKVVKFSRQGSCDVAYLKREVREREYPVCGEHACIKGRRWRKVWHTPAHNCPLVLMIEVTRMQCTKCKKTWNEHHEMIGTASIHMTKDVQDAILVDLMDKKSVKATSEKTGPSPHMVNCVLDQAVLSASYLPQTLCIDRFHVVKLVNDAFNDVRKRVQKDEELPVSLRKEIRSAWKLFLTKPEELERIDFAYAKRLAANRATLMSTLDLSEEEIADLSHLKPREARVARVERLLDTYPDLKASYELMHLFREWSDVEWCADKRDSLAR